MEQVLLQSKVKWGPMGTKVGLIDIVLGLKDDQFERLTVRGKVGLFGLETNLEVSKSYSDLSKGDYLALKFDKSSPPLITIGPVDLADSNSGLAKLNLHMGSRAYQTIDIPIQHNGSEYYPIDQKKGQKFDLMTLSIGGMSLKKLHIKKCELS